MKIIKDTRTHFWLFTVLVIGLFFIIGGIYFNTDTEPSPDSTSTTPAKKATSTISKRPNAPNYIKVDSGPYPALGSSSAPVKIVEFGDFQCPFCSDFHREVFPELKKEYIDEGKVEFFFRDFPFSDLHPDTIKAHRAARCGLAQDNFWELHDWIFKNQDRLNFEKLEEAASELELNQAEFRGCLESEKFKELVEQSYHYARGLDFRSTPTFLISSKDIRYDQANKEWIQKELKKEEKIKLDYGQGWIVVGAQNFETFQEIIDSELSNK